MTFIIKIADSLVPITFKYLEISQHLAAIKEFKPFKDWISEWDNVFLKPDHASNGNIRLKGIEIEDITFFGGSKIGFMKIHADMTLKDIKVPGVVFLRGDSVALFVVIYNDHIDKKLQQDPLVVFVRQLRVPIACTDYWELPAGMMDDSKNFQSVAVKELQEECGIHISKQDLQLLGSRLTVSPGGSDEKLSIYLVEKTLSEKDISELEGRLGGVQHEGEQIRLSLVNLSKIPSFSTSLSVLAAFALYQAQKGLKKNH